MVKKRMTDSERQLFELVKIALAQLQDDEALVSELIALQEPPSQSALLHKANIGHASAHIQEKLRGMGLAVKKREPFHDDIPVWQILRSLK